MTTSAPTREGRPYRALASSTLSISLGALPVFLLGAMAVLMREELGFGEAALGAVASSYYAASAIVSVPGGWVADRVGGRRSMALAASITLAAMIGVATANSLSMLFAFMILAGVANGMALPASNRVLAMGVPARRQGVAFGVKQSSGPIATLVAGAALPMIGLTVGWRWSWVLAGLTAIPLILAARRRRVPGVRSSPGSLSLPQRRALRLMAVGAAAAVFGGSSLAAFYVESAVSAGIAPGLAGSLLAIGSLFGIGARIGWGWLGDLRPGRHVVMLGSIMGFGAVGYVLMGAVSSANSLVAATLVTFMTGWAWPGLFIFTVVSRCVSAPGAATGIVGTGLYSGGIVGPLVFGWIVEQATYRAAWSFIAGAAVFSSFLMTWGAGRLDRTVKATAGERR